MQPHHITYNIELLVALGTTRAVLIEMFLVVAYNLIDRLAIQKCEEVSHNKPQCSFSKNILGDTWTRRRRIVEREGLFLAPGDPSGQKRQDANTFYQFSNWLHTFATVGLQQIFQQLSLLKIQLQIGLGLVGN